MQMKKAEVKQARCVACRESVPNFEIVSVGSIEEVIVSCAAAALTPRWPNWAAWRDLNIST